MTSLELNVTLPKVAWAVGTTVVTILAGYWGISYVMLQSLDTRLSEHQIDTRANIASQDADDREIRKNLRVAVAELREEIGKNSKALSQFGLKIEKSNTALGLKIVEANEKLVAAIKERFGEVDKRFNKIDETLETIKKRLPQSIIDKSSIDKFKDKKISPVPVRISPKIGGLVSGGLKVGFVYNGPIGKHGWTYRHDAGRLAIMKALGSKVITSYVESVEKGVDAERAISRLIANGHKLIFTTSFGYTNATNKIAKRFPTVKFEQATGSLRAKNIATYTARFYEGRTVAGLIAGYMTESDTIGYIGSFPIPEVVRGINAFTLELRRINPRAKVKVIWISSWYDPSKEGAAAKALIDQGADVILQHTDSPVPLQIAEKRGVWAIGQVSDMTKFGKKAHLTSIVNVWDRYYVERTKAVLNGTWKSTGTWGGLKAGMVKLAPFNIIIPLHIRAEAKRTIAAIMSGKRHPFQGPIKRQDGKVMVAAGAVATDKQLLTMDWYVKGVEGKMPK